MPWLFASPDHQQPWCWPWKNGSLLSIVLEIISTTYKTPVSRNDNDNDNDNENNFIAM